jgi:hypothetical protein
VAWKHNRCSALPIFFCRVITQSGIPRWKQSCIQLGRLREYALISICHHYVEHSINASSISSGLIPRCLRRGRSFVCCRSGITPQAHGPHARTRYCTLIHLKIPLNYLVFTSIISELNVFPCAPFSARYCPQSQTSTETSLRHLHEAPEELRSMTAFPWIFEKAAVLVFFWSLASLRNA